MKERVGPDSWTQERARHLAPQSESEAETRPPAELKWIAELGFHNLGVQPSV